MYFIILYLHKNKNALHLIKAFFFCKNDIILSKKSALRNNREFSSVKQNEFINVQYVKSNQCL